MIGTTQGDLIMWKRFVSSGGLALSLYVIPQMIAVAYYW